MTNIVSKIGEPAAYENLAEECAELAQAALKMARVLRKENPTPVTLGQAHANCIEEYTDVFFLAHSIGLLPDSDILEEKSQRFNERWKNRDK